MSSARTLGLRAATLALYAGAATVGIVAVTRSFARELDISLVVWSFGMIAAFFGAATAVLGAAAIGRRDHDRADMQSFIGTMLLLVSGPATTGWWGPVAAAILLAGWLMAGFERRRHRHAWRNARAEREAFFRGLGKRDPRDDPNAARFLGTARVVDELPTEARSDASDEDYATTRWQLKARAREIDADPWQSPPS